MAIGYLQLRPSPDDLPRARLPPAKPEPKLFKVVVSILWFITFALPWMWRRARGKSSGDGRGCKYPIAIHWPLNLD